jgi:peptide deformylase
MNNTNDEIVFNTEKVVEQSFQAPKIEIEVPTFDLVSEHDTILREVLPEFDFNNPPVDPNAFASSLVETCKKKRGFGLSANQCGFNYRVFVMGSGDEYVAFFNPKIIGLSGECHMEEGCLSFPNLALRITRPATIAVEYQDFTGETKTQTFSGISARCFQHELDHMNGIVYTQKAKPLALQVGLKKREKFKRLMVKAQKSMQKLEKIVNVNTN